MNDVKPPRRPAPVVAPKPSPELLPEVLPSIEIEQPGILSLKPRRHWLRWFMIGLLTLIALSVAGGYMWYSNALRPVDTQASASIKVVIESGQTPDQIAETLKSKGIIRDTRAFDIYTRLSNTRNKLRAGTYQLMAKSDLPTIVQHLVDGKTDQLIITFYPGATLTDMGAKGTKMDVTSVLKQAGFAEADIQAALAKTYSGPLFADKPSGTDLEGYIYGDTYQFDADATVEKVLQTTFDEYYDRLQANDLITKFKVRGLTLFQAITLASIVQKEAATATDQAGAAQVFEKRLAIDMSLGSDVTFIYAAHKLGVAPTTDLDSPYNTRLYKGLPPGPIATPGLSALQAVATPAATDYLYFLAGDDGVVRYASTLGEHDQNIALYCKVNCSTP